MSRRHRIDFALAELRTETSKLASALVSALYNGDPLPGGAIQSIEKAQMALASIVAYTHDLEEEVICLADDEDDEQRAAQ